MILCHKIQKVYRPANNKNKRETSKKITKQSKLLLRKPHTNTSQAVNFERYSALPLDIFFIKLDYIST